MDVLCFIAIIIGFILVLASYVILEHDRNQLAVCVVGCVLFVGGLMGILGLAEGRAQVQKDAVRHNAGHYVSHVDENGHAKVDFVWGLQTNKEECNND